MTRGRKFNTTLLLLPVLCLAIAGYFGYHAAQSMVKLKALQDEAGAIKVKLTAVETKRKALERRVVLLRPSTLDPDMMDERARAAINAADPQDIIIFRKQKQ